MLCARQYGGSGKSNDLGLHESVAAGPEERYNLTMRFEFFKLFNRAQLGGPDQNMLDSTFG